MAHNYLQFSLDVVRALVGPENAQLLQLNASQCGALKRKLLETATSIQDFVYSLSPIHRRLYEKSCETALQEFYRVVKDAEAIIHSCCDKNWLQAAIKLANNTEAFVDVIFKLDWCTAVLCNLSRDVIPGEWNLPKYFATLIGEVDRVGRMGEIERMLRVDAMDDRENLRRRLGELQNSTEALDLRQDIILHLLRITDPAAEDEQKTGKGDFLLTIEPKELKKLELIAAGAFARVRKINWRGENFVGKYYKYGSATYLNERKVLADLSHPHVVQVFGCTISDPCCLVMELMHTDLGHHIQRFSTSMSSDREALFELPVAVDIMLQIAEGMEYLHRKGIVHRDLKSMKILVNRVSIPEMADAGYVQVKVAGFTEAIASTGCLAKNHVPEICSLEECFSELEVVGTTPWMAPELGNYESCRGNPFKTDVYSFAITCSEILTGEVPFESLRRSEVRARVKEGMRPTLPAYLPTSLSSLIKCCWDTDARMRPPFSEICAKLRHVKYLLMSVDAAAICEKWKQDQWGSMFTKSEVYQKPVVGEIGTLGSIFVKGLLERLSGHELGICESKLETHAMPTSGKTGTYESKLETHAMPTSGKIGTCGSMIEKLETHETPTSDEIGTRRSMIEKLETHDMPTSGEIGMSGMNFLDWQYESGSLICFCWRVVYGYNTLELIFPSAMSMSCVVGLGLEFAKVVVNPSNWEVEIINIGQENWEVMWTELSGLDKKHKVGGIFSVKMMGGGLQDDLTKEYFGGIESAQKYGVGLSIVNSRAYVQFTNVLQERDHCLVLHKIVEYLMLEKVDLAKIGNQCAVSGEAGSSSRGANNSDQVNNDGTWIGQTLSNFRSWFSKGKSKSNGDDDDNRSPSNKEPPKLEDESASKNTCKITVRPGAGGSFWNEADRQFLEAPFKSLNGASIDPTLVFVFDKNGSFGKQILVTTTTSFDLGKSAPQREWNGSFGWYHNLLVTSLTNLPKHAVLETTLCKLLMENPKDTKSSVKQIDTHSSTSTLEGSIDGRLGFQNTHIGGSFRSTETGGKTFAREEAHENSSSSDMWRGFIYRDLSEPLQSSACYDFDCSLPSPTLEVLKDPLERKRYMGSGMCGAVRPTFVGAWSIVPDDTTEDSKYAFEAERTLKHLYKIGEEEREHKTIQKYHVKILVNHAMTHLCNVKGDHVLREKESLLKVMRVSARGI